MKVIFVRPVGLDIAHECFENCRCLAADGTGWLFQQGAYMRDGKIPYHHCWLVDEDGNIVEPTMRRGTGASVRSGIGPRTSQCSKASPAALRLDLMSPLPASPPLTAAT